VCDRFSLILMLLCLSTAGVAVSSRADVAPSQGQHALIPLYPARPTFGSGTVFRINRSVDGSRYTRVLCRNLFAGVTPEREPYTVKSAVFTEPGHFDKAAGILYGVLTNAQQTAENLRTKKARSVKLSYQDATLELAQYTKYDLVAQKLRLESGMRLLDVGCGWGGMVMHAAEHYGVKALGVTLSRQQAEWAQKAIAERGLADRAEVRFLDYRDVPETGFDAVSSIGLPYGWNERPLSSLDRMREL